MIRQLFVHKTKPCPQRFEPIENYERYPKPTGGVWTSSLDEQAQLSEWVEWCRREEFGAVDKKRWWALTPCEQTRLYEIQLLSDLQRALEWYPDQTKPHRLDFQAMAADGWEGIHLTSDGQWETRLSFPENLYGWDVESTLWFTWKFTEVELYRDLTRKTKGRQTA